MISVAKKLSFSHAFSVSSAANDNYHLRLVSNITPANNQTLTYDALNRLLTASGNYGSLAYGYDGNNNRTSQTFSGTGTAFSYQAWYGGAGDRLHQGVTGSSTQSFINTNGGNLTNFSPALPSGVSAVNYNYAEQMANVTGGAGTIASYTYDGFGRRVAKTVSGTSTYYAYAPDGTLLEEQNSSGAAVADYLYIPETYSFLPAFPYLGAHPVAEYLPASSTLTFVHADRIGAPLAVDNLAGATQWQATYQPFGLANVTTSTITQDLRLPGQYYDAETGFHHNGAREYMPGGPAGTPSVPGGRYLQMDPLFLAGNRFDPANPNAVIGGLNPFSYANQNPGTWIDPWGLRPLTTGEQQAASSEFPNSIPSNVNITYNQSGNAAFTSGNNIDFPSSSSWCQDFTTCNGAPYTEWFIHEYTHTQQSCPILGHIFSHDIFNTGDYLNLSQYKQTPSPNNLDTEQEADWHKWHYACSHGLDSNCSQ